VTASAFARRSLAWELMGEVDELNSFRLADQDPGTDQKR